MRLFTRKPRGTILQRAIDDTDPGILRFLTRGGANVVVTERSHRYEWACLGCGADDFRGPYTDRDHARDAANGHAGSCWSMPKPEASR